MSSGGSLLIGGIFAGIGAGVGSLIGQTQLGAQLGWIGGSMLGGGLFNEDDKPNPKKLNLEKIASQISTYGAEIPTVYGNGRVSGNIIWADQRREVLNEDKSEYEYTLSFALALNEGTIGGIRKMWADSKLLFDQSELQTLASKFVEAKFADDIVFYDGTQTEPDPLMLDKLESGNCPIYKGVCYVVFKNFKLGAYGNRLPNIEVELASSAEIIDNLSLSNDVNLYPTSIEVLSGDLYVSFSEKEYKSSGIYTPPKIKKMKGISTIVDWEIEIPQVQTIKSFKFFNNGIKFVTIPIDFVLDVGNTGTENDMTSFSGAMYTYSGQFIKTINFADTKVSTMTWNPDTVLERNITELNGFVAEDIDIIKDELFKDAGWLDAILNNELTDYDITDLEELRGRDIIVVTGTKWWFDTNNEWPEQPNDGNYILIGKEHLYSSPFVKIYDGSGEFIGDEFLTKTIEAMNGYPELKYDGSSGTSGIAINNTIHEGYFNFTYFYQRYASGGRPQINFFQAYLFPNQSDPSLNDYVLPGTNNLAVTIRSSFYTTTRKEVNLEKEGLFVWLLDCVDDNADYKQIITCHRDRGVFRMVNTPKKPYYWDITNIFSPTEKTINMSKYLFENKLFILLISDLGNVKVIKEGFYDKTWEDIPSGGQEVVYTGSRYEEINFERFIANNVTISSIIEDLYDKVGITSFDNSAIDGIEIGGYLRDKNVSAKSMIQPLLTAFNIDIIEVDWELRATIRDDSIDLVMDENYISVGENTYNDDFTENLFNRENLPNIMKVTYIDILRDYQANTKIANWIDLSTRNEMDLSLPFIVSDVQAKQIAEKKLQYFWNTRSSFSFSSTVRYLYIVPNDIVTIKGKVIRINTVDYDTPNRLRFTGLEIRAGMYENNTLTLSNPTSQDDPANTLSDVSAILVHTTSINKENDAGYYVAMFSNKTWRGGGIYIGDTGQNMNLIASTDNESDIGTLVYDLPLAVSTTTFDYGTKITVKMQKNSKYLRTIEEIEVLNYSNIIVIGIDNYWEQVSYTTATFIGNLTWELTGLIRGVNGTDSYNMSHSSGSWVIPVDGLTHVPLANNYYKQYLYMKILPLSYGTSNSYTEKVISLGRILDVFDLGDVFAYREQITKDWVISWRYRTRINGEWKSYGDIVNIDGPPTFYVIIKSPTSTKKYIYEVVGSTEFTYEKEDQLLDWPNTDLTSLKIEIAFYNNWSNKTFGDYDFSE